MKGIAGETSNMQKERTSERVKMHKQKKIKVRERATKKIETILASKGQKGEKGKWVLLKELGTLGNRERERERLRENVRGWKNRGEWKQTRRFVSD